MPTFLDNNFQDVRMFRSLRLKPLLHAENPTQISSPGGGTFLDSPNRLENSGVERKFVTRRNAKRRNVRRKRRTRLISSEMTTRRTLRPRRNSRFLLSTTRRMLPNLLLRNPESSWKSRDSRSIRTSMDLPRKSINKLLRMVSLGNLVIRLNHSLSEWSSSRSAARSSMLRFLSMMLSRRSKSLGQRRFNLLTSNHSIKNDLIK